MWQDLKVAVIIPAFNEQRLLPLTLASIPDFIDTIFVVNDASGDDTAQVLEAQTDTRLNIITHPVNRGVGAAIVSGYQHACASHDVLVVMAADNQMNPEDLQKLLRAIQSGADYVKGNRFLHPRYRQMPLQRRLGGMLLAQLTSFASGLKVDDSQCGYTAITSRCARQLPLEELWPRFGYPNDLLLMLGAFGKDVREVPVEPIYRDEESGIHLGHAFTIAWRTWSRRKRFLSALTPGSVPLQSR